jgi:hypothetical protein
MYVKPDVTRYSGTELLDLMGPVETGYCEIPDTIVNCERAYFEVPLCLKDPDFIVFEVIDSSYSMPIDDPQVASVENGIAAINGDSRLTCDMPGGTHDLTISIITGEPGESEEYCVACVQEISVRSEAPPITYTGTGAGDIDGQGGWQY